MLALGSGPAWASDEGLYGAQDPTYDGVYRQSVSLLALDASGTTPAAATVQWLLDQQCANGAWTSYRPDLTDECAPGTEDSNATAAAVQALAARGVSPTHDAVAWLRSIQNDDGGFPYGPGGASDANSTALALGALTAAGVDPMTVTSASGASGFDALAALQLSCGTEAATLGAFDYSRVDFAGNPKASLEANDFATVQAVPGLLGLTLVTPPAATPVATVPDCPAGPADDPQRAAWGADYLQRTITANPDGPFLSSVFGPGADYGSTANAVLALTATGVSPETATAAADWLSRNAVPDWVPDADGEDRPAALATLILVARATGMDPTDFAGADLLQRLVDTGPAAPAEPAGPGQTPGQAPGETDPDSAPAPVAAPVELSGTPTLPDTGVSSALLLAATVAGATLTAVGVGLQRWGTES